MPAKGAAQIYPRNLIGRSLKSSFKAKELVYKRQGNRVASGPVPDRFRRTHLELVVVLKSSELGKLLLLLLGLGLVLDLLLVVVRHGR